MTTAAERLAAVAHQVVAAHRVSTSAMVSDEKSEPAPCMPHETAEVDASWEYRLPVQYLDLRRDRLEVTL